MRAVEKMSWKWMLRFLTWAIVRAPNGSEFNQERTSTKGQSLQEKT